MPVKLNSTGGGSVTLTTPSTASDFTLTVPAVTATLATTTGGNTVEFGAGSASTPSITTTGDLNTGAFFPAADTVAVATAGTERARINSDGALLVSTTSYNYSFTGNAVQIGAGANSSISSKSTTSNTNHIVFNNGNGQVGFINTSGSSTSFGTSSDYRIKENVVPLTNAAARVQALKPSRFNFIADPGRTVDGFIAHEAAEVVPEAVAGEKDALNADGSIKPQGIDHSKLVPLLTAALQEALTEIILLKDRITTLEAK
jgi:hypothetical protein